MGIATLKPISATSNIPSKIEGLISLVSAKLINRTDFASRGGINTIPAWENQLLKILSPYPPNTKIDFLKIANIYLEDKIPPAKLFRYLSTNAFLLSKLTELTSRYHLWNDKSILEFSKYIKAAVARISKKTSLPPIIVEVCAGYGDLAFGISQIMPEISIIATDGYSATKKDGQQKNKNGVCYSYKHSIIRKRGIRNFVIDNNLDSSLKSALGISNDSPLIIIASHLPLNKGIEKILLNQTSVDEMIVIHLRSGVRTTGDTDLIPNRKVWNSSLFSANPDIWFGGSIFETGYTKEIIPIEINLLSRKNKPDKLTSDPGILDRKAAPSTGKMLRLTNIPGSKFLDWLYGYIGFDIEWRTFIDICEKITLSQSEYEEAQGLVDLLLAASTHEMAKSNFSRIKDILMKRKSLDEFRFDTGLPEGSAIAASV